MCCVYTSGSVNDFGQSPAFATGMFGLRGRSNSETCSAAAQIIELALEQFEFIAIDGVELLRDPARKDRYVGLIRRPKRRDERGEWS
jgi:hypothetical protein